MTSIGQYLDKGGKIVPLLVYTPRYRDILGI